MELFRLNLSRKDINRYTEAKDIVNWKHNRIESKIIGNIHFCARDASNYNRHVTLHSRVVVIAIGAASSLASSGCVFYFRACSWLGPLCPLHIATGAASSFHIHIDTLYMNCDFYTLSSFHFNYSNNASDHFNPCVEMSAAHVLYMYICS